MDDRFENLLSMVDWFFQTEDALKYLRQQVSNGKATLSTYKELAVWAGTVESDLRVLCETRTCGPVQLPLFTVSSKKTLPTIQAIHGKLITITRAFPGLPWVKKWK